MSLCIALIDDQKIFMAADTATSTKSEGKCYRLREDCQKLFVADDMLIFLSGDVDLSRLVIEDFMRSSNKSIETLQGTMKAFVKRYIEIRPGFVEYEKQNIGLVALVADRKEGKTRLIEISSKQNFELNIITPPAEGKFNYYVTGVKSEEVSEYLGGLFETEQSANANVIDTYNQFSCEQIGGELQTYLLDVSGIHSLGGCAIMEPTGMNRIQRPSLDQSLLRQCMFESAVIVGSSIDVGNGKFTVSSAGAMNAEGGILTKGTITGALIRTAATGQRVEMDATGLYAKDSSNRIRVSIAQSGKYGVAGTEYNDESGTFKGGVYGVYEGLYIEAPKLLNLYSPRIDMHGVVDFGNASATGISKSAITGLDTELTSIRLQIDGKASKGSSTDSAGPYNCGIPIGTQFKSIDGAVYTWAGVPAHSHNQR